MEAQHKAGRLVALAAAQVNQQNVDALGHVRNVDDDNMGDDELVDPMNRKRANNDAPVNRNQQARGKGRQQPAVGFALDDDDTDLDEAGVTGAIKVPPWLWG